jgi:lipopolysaccharide/colanic/teichoic acid biosynthesis glycosyltransferase
VLATLAVIVLAPLILILVVAIRLDSAGPAILRQRRLGRYGRVFHMYKLRSMYDNCAVHFNADGSTCVVEGDPRVTRVGRWLRTVGLDELLQLINVIKGEMSIVGPRPDQDFHLQWYTVRGCRKLAMRPGITSLGQVSGRNAIPWERRFEYELVYVEQFSLWLDFRILLLTIKVVLSGFGSYNNTGERARRGVAGDLAASLADTGKSDSDDQC